MLVLADALNSIIQAFMFVVTVNYCVEKNIKRNKSTIILTALVLWLGMQISFMAIGNSSLNIIVTHILDLVILGVVYRKDLLGTIISFNIVYLMIGVSTIVITNIFFGFVQPRLPEAYVELGILLIVYGSQFILALFVFTKVHKLYNLYRSIRTKNYSIISLVLITVAVDFVGSLNIILHDQDNPIFKNVIFALLALFLIASTAYFANIEKKMREIKKLNSDLDDKMNELKAVKQEYSSQISHLYELHLMEDNDRSKELLKGIINGENIGKKANTCSDIDSIITIAAKSLVPESINLIIDEKANLNSIEMSEMELQRIVSNIINNSVTAMSGKGMLTIKTYENKNNIVIQIENNGPKIENEVIDKIFQAGFSTKDDKEKDHGFGLAIVKEIIEKYDGRILVDSDFDITEFEITLPKRLN